jgi:hypothetical protein
MLPAAFFPSAMFLPAPMLRETFTLQFAFTRFPAVFLAAGTTPVPLNLLNGERLPARWGRQGMSRRRRYRSDCQQAKNREASHDVTHCLLPPSNRMGGRCGKWMFAMWPNCAVFRDNVIVND